MDWLRAPPRERLQAKFENWLFAIVLYGALAGAAAKALL